LSSPVYGADIRGYGLRSIDLIPWLAAHHPEVYGPNAAKIRPHRSRACWAPIRISEATIPAPSGCTGGEGLLVRHHGVKDSTERGGQNDQAEGQA
jgi:hypothetical protein